MTGRVAIIGSGISGLALADALHPTHDVTVFEAADRIGGHCHTVEVAHGPHRHAVDTGFIVYNRRTYPRFSQLLDRLGVPSRPTSMCFSVSDEHSGLEYAVQSLGALFAQRRNLLRPRFLRLVADLLRFNHTAPGLLGAPAGADEELTLADYLRRERYSASFVDHYVIPMGAAIWSTAPQRMLGFPARFFVRFLHHHGMLTVAEQPVWRTVVGGSRRYVEALIAPFAERIRAGQRVRRVERGAAHVTLSLQTADDATVRRATFDQVVFATHSDQALALLADPSDAEREILGAIPYQRNDAVLHTDTGVLPRSRRAWASWNCYLPARPAAGVAVTYDLTRLQGHPAPPRFCVTLGRTAAIDPRRVLARFVYQHPLFTAAAPRAQARHAEISGVRRTHYCGAYWRNGFHEDGVWSAARVARWFGATRRRAAEAPPPARGQVAHAG